ncbi:MAG: deoxyribose-phosphate aldolase [Ignavibacteria bacterium]|nr:deoxyribose-phosphate aldolase [Ignavibacteria bacterium]
MNEVENLKRFIDHTNLRNNISKEELRIFCKEAADFGFYSVCLQPYYVSDAFVLLKGTNVKVCSVVDFPYGSSPELVKLALVENLVKMAVDEIDMVMNVPAFVNKDYELVQREIRNSVVICHSHNVKIKIIIETGLLIPEEIALATQLVCQAGADFVKTSTGVISRGVIPKDIEIIKENLSGETKIKASGGIKTLNEILSYIQMGVSRIGTSRSVEIFKGLVE